ncbi:tetratricopeptide repeat protein [Parerythrobacter jejuensis]|uniref:Cytochrome C biogenesis protein n=1 Tax=Parerythrobacter jejuensis TaxID=795812 RepID=A0A845ARE7_9SPHN|nr:tetratricopeptide repeat protein [Parerythrobacter jejuensis]MXP32059.1 cytochrome C biogenesis protein [Parerythrobacter jejuensis]
MIGWLAIGAVALVAFALGAWLLREQRNLLTLLAAIIVFGLAGYAWQGAPSYPAAPATATSSSAANPGLIEARREFFDPANTASRFVVVADGFARNGDFERAAVILRGAVVENPNDGEAWLALGVALVEHAEGEVTPPALFAFQRARALLTGNPAPAFFLGVSELRAGRLIETRELWAQALEAAPEGAPGRTYLAERLAGLDALMAEIVARQTPQ